MFSATCGTATSIGVNQTPFVSSLPAGDDCETHRPKCYNCVTTAHQPAKAQRQMLIKLTERERATFVASLRRWLSYPAAREADSIATGGGKYKPLDDGEIQRLCKRVTEKECKQAVGPLFHQSTNGDGAGWSDRRKPSYRSGSTTPNAKASGT